MTVRSFPQLITFLSLFLVGAAFAQESGSTSGAPSGTNVKPSTAIQKENSGRPGAGGEDLQGSSNAAGAPGVEGKPGAESGPAPEGRAQPPK